MDTRALDVVLTQRAAIREQAEQALASALSRVTKAKEAVATAGHTLRDAVNRERAHRLPQQAMGSCSLARYAIERGGLLVAVQDARRALLDAQAHQRQCELLAETAKTTLETTSRDEEVVKRALERTQSRDLIEHRRKLDDGDE